MTQRRPGERSFPQKRVAQTLAMELLRSGTIIAFPKRALAGYNGSRITLVSGKVTGRVVTAHTLPLKAPNSSKLID